jgi:choline-sulfatase
MILGWLACATPQPDLLLITLDTTRADAIGVYGASPSPTPELDRLAAEGATVADAHTPAPLTLPAHAALFTGRSPDATGLHLNLSRPLPKTFPTLATELHDRGWQTGAFVGAAVLARRFGLDRGFDLYDDRFDPNAGSLPGDAVVRWPCDEVESRANAWIDALDPSRPSFGWVHFYDAHQPTADYGAAIHRMDAALGRLVARWTSRRGAPRVIVVGDHGESRGEHGELEHGLFLYEATTRVPWVMHGPGVTHQTIRGVHSLEEVAPTALALLGVTPTEVGAPGAASALSATPHDAVTAEAWQGRAQYGFAELRAVITPDWRFIQAPRPELYDRRTDPHDRRDVAADHPDVVAALRRRLADAPPADLASSQDAETSAMLARLGYQSGPTAVAPDATWQTLPDPKDHPRLPLDFAELVVAARTRPPAEAVPVITAFLQQHPGVGAAHLLLSAAEERAGHPDRALAALAPLLAIDPDDPAVSERRAALLLATGDTAGAESAAAHLTGPRAIGVRAEALRRRGALASALDLLNPAIAAHPDDGELRLVRGACLLATGDLDGAIADLERATGPDRDRWLGVALARRGEPRAIPYLERSRGTPETDAALGLAYYAASRWDDAYATLRPLANRTDLGSQPLIAYADTVVRTSHATADARTALDLAGTVGPDSAFEHRIRSAVAMADGDVATSVDEMARAGALSDAPWLAPMAPPKLSPPPPEALNRGPAPR